MGSWAAGQEARARVGSWTAGQEVVVAGQRQRTGQLMPSLAIRSHSVELVSEKESKIARVRRRRDVLHGTQFHLVYCSLPSPLSRSVLKRHIEKLLLVLIFVFPIRAHSSGSCCFFGTGFVRGCETLLKRAHCEAHLVSFLFVLAAVICNSILH